MLDEEVGVGKGGRASIRGGGGGRGEEGEERDEN